MHTHGRRPQSTGRAGAPLAFLRLRWARPWPLACTSSLRSESPPLRWPCTLRRFTYASARCAVSSLTRRTRQSAVAPAHVRDVGHAHGARAPRSHGGHTRSPAKAMPRDPKRAPCTSLGAGRSLLALCGALRARRPFAARGRSPCAPLRRPARGTWAASPHICCHTTRG